MPIEQSESKLVQDVILVSDVPTPFHAGHEILSPNGTIDLCKTKRGNSSTKLKYSRYINVNVTH